MDKAAMADEPEAPIPGTWLSVQSADVARAMATPPGVEWTAEDDAVCEALSEASTAGGNGDYPLTGEVLIAFLASAHGLHAAAASLRAAGFHEWAEVRASHGQVFLEFVADYLLAVGAQHAAQEQAQPGDTVH